MTWQKPTSKKCPKCGNDLYKDYVNKVECLKKYKSDTYKLLL